MLGIRIPLGLLAALLAFAVSTSGVANATVIEIGGLNVIDDAGNPSDGLAFLDLAFSDGLTLAGALTNAQSTYPGARVATPSEFDDLFAAAGIVYDGALTASDGFAAGPTATIASASAAGAALHAQLGATNPNNVALMWTDPDGLIGDATTRDTLNLSGNGQVNILQRDAGGGLPPNSNIGWLLVVPEPGTFSLVALGTLALGLRRRRLH